MHFVSCWSFELNTPSSQATPHLASESTSGEWPFHSTSDSRRTTIYSSVGELSTPHALLAKLYVFSMPCWWVMYYRVLGNLAPLWSSYVYMRYFAHRHRFLYLGLDSSRHWFTLCEHWSRLWGSGKTFPTSTKTHGQEVTVAFPSLHWLSLLGNPNRRKDHSLHYAALCHY